MESLFLSSVPNDRGENLETLEESQANVYTTDNPVRRIVRQISKVARPRLSIELFDILVVI